MVKKIVSNGDKVFAMVIRTETAKQIFEDIEKLPRIECNQTAYIHPNSIKKLKKKWTE